MIELLLKLEMSLWLNETRRNHEYMNSVLHDDFKEFGQSGKIFNKQDILNDLEVDISVKFPFTNVDIKQIGENSFLITYQTENFKNSKFIKSNRASIWVGVNTFQLLFHQGTLVE